MQDSRSLAGSRRVHVRIHLAREDNASTNRELPPVLIHANFYATTDMLAKIAYYNYQSYLPPRMGSQSGMADPWGAAWFALDSGAVVSGRQVPIGALFQHMCPADMRPLQLTVHFSQQYPDAACPFVASSRHKQHLIFNPRHMYFNNLKEALLIQTGRATQVLELLEDEREQLWQAARDGDLACYQRRLDHLKHTAIVRPGQETPQVPLRVLLAGGSSEGMEDRGFFSRPVPAVFPDGTSLTLLDAIYSICPEALAPAVSCRLQAADVAPEEGAAAVRLECDVQLVVEDVVATGGRGEDEDRQAAGSAERPAGDAGSAERPAGDAGGAGVGAPAPVQEEAEGDVADAAAEGADAGEGDGEVAAVEEAVSAAGEAGAQSGADEGRGVRAEGEEGAGDAGVGAAAVESAAGECAPELEGGEQEGGERGGAAAGAGVERGGAGVPAPWRPSRDSVGAKPAGVQRAPYRRVVRGHLREGVCVYVGGLRAHVQQDILRGSLGLLHDVLRAPDLFLYVVVHGKAEKQRVAEAVEDLRKMQVDREAAQEIIKLWKESGVTEDPEELQKLYKEKSTGALARFGVQIFLDACACYAAYAAASAINDGGDFFGKPILVFIFSAVTFNYALALISNVLSLSVSIRSMNRFGTNAVAYLEAVKEIAGPTSLDSFTRVQSVIDCMKIASSLEKVDIYLKERADSAESTMQTMERLGVYFVLNRAREQGFEPEKFGMSETEAVTIARMFTKYDTNDDGRIDQRELEQLCRDAGRDMSPEEVKAALQAIDENGNGYIEFNEFAAFWANPEEKVAAAQAAQEPPKEAEAATGTTPS
eukprot:jgi/Ulvmu1/9158/UM005_0256.1